MINKFTSRVIPPNYFDFNEEEKKFLIRSILNETKKQTDKIVGNNFYDFSTIINPIIENTLRFYEKREDYETCIFFRDMSNVLEDEY